MNYPTDPDLLYGIVILASGHDQALFNPTTVAGWPGNRNWITTSSITTRWEGITNSMGYFFQFGGTFQLSEMAVGLTSPVENDPEVVTRAIIDHFLPKGLQNDFEYAEALAAFKGEIPENYFQDGIWNLHTP